MSDDPVPGPRLTERERMALVLMSQGLTYQQASRKLGASGSYTARTAARRATEKLGAATITQAVHIAGHLGLIGWGPECGTRNEYLKHLRRGEPACLPCRRANAAVAAEQRRRENKQLREERASAGPHVRNRTQSRGTGHQ